MRPKNKPLILAGLCTICCLCMGSAQESNTKPQPVSPPDVPPKVLATCELPGQWKATLFSRPITYTIHFPKKDFRRSDTLFYIEVLPDDSNAPRRIWQMSFLANREAPESIPRDFMLGPGDKHHLCVAVLQWYLVHFFVIDLREDVKPSEEAANADTGGGPPVNAGEDNPNMILLDGVWKILGKDSLPRLGGSKISIDAIFCAEDSWMLHLNVDEQRLAVRCIPGTAEPNYVVYRVTKPAKKDAKAKSRH